MKTIFGVLVGLLLALASNAKEASPTKLPPVELLLLSPSGEVIEGVTGEFRLTPASSETLDPIEVALGPKGKTVIPLPAGSQWTLQLEAPGYWATSRAISVSPDPLVEESERVTAWPTARLVGQVQSEDGSPITHLGVTFQGQLGTQEGRELGMSKAACTVAEDGQFSCDLPATSLDLALRPRGFVPHYRWGLSLPAGGEQSLGKIQLSLGASIAGRVDVAEGKFEPKKCSVRLLPMQAGRGSAFTSARLKQSATTTGGVAENGFFQIADVKPGAYLLEVEHPGYASARLAPVELVPGAETSLQGPLTLERPVTLQLSISPPMAPTGKPWFVRVRRALDYSSRFDGPPVFDGVTTAEGLIQIPEQAPGRFAVDVAAGRGHRYYSDQALYVTSAADAHHEIRLELVQVRGRVLFGDSGVAATLFFGGERGAERVAIESDAEGEFSGLLPREGSWMLEVDTKAPKVRRQSWVNVEPNREGEAVVEVRLPDTEISGVVVDPEGQPVAKADVSLGDLGEGLFTRSDEEGQFVFRAFEEGSVSLSASTRASQGGMASAGVTHVVVEGIPAGPVELRLEPKRTVRGSVVSHLGPVVGATVLVATLDSQVGGATRRRTDISGQFTVEVPERARTVQVTVSPPGGAFQTFAFEVSEALPPIRTSASGGTLDIEVPESEGGPWLLVVEQNGLVLPFGPMLRWAQSHRGGFTQGRDQRYLLPMLAAGPYRACLASRRELNRSGLATGDWRNGLKNCETGYLMEGGELQWKLVARQPGDDTYGREGE